MNRYEIDRIIDSSFIIFLILIPISMPAGSAWKHGKRVKCRNMLLMGTSCVLCILSSVYLYYIDCRYRRSKVRRDLLLQLERTQEAWSEYGKQIDLRSTLIVPSSSSSRLGR